MDNEAKLKKFANIIKPLDMNDLLNLRDFAIDKLGKMPKAIARKSYLYKSLCVLEERMVEMGGGVD